MHFFCPALPIFKSLKHQRSSQDSDFKTPAILLRCLNLRLSSCARIDLQQHVMLDLRLTTIQLESQLLRDGDGGEGYGCLWKVRGLESHIQEHNVSLLTSQRLFFLQDTI